MVKKVNIRASVPIKDFKPPIYGTCNGIEMSTGDILKCLCKHAIVEEVLPDGSTVRLDMKNYYTDNAPKTVKVPAASEVQVVETSVPDEVHNELVDEPNLTVECETAAADVSYEADAVEDYVPEEDTTAETAVVNDTVFVEEYAHVEDTAETVVAADESTTNKEVTENAETATVITNTAVNKTTTYNNNNSGKKKKKH